MLGFSEGVPISVMFAATYPERVRALVLYGAYASGSMDDDGSPRRDKWIRLGNQIRESIDHWGEGRSVDWAAPSLSSNFVYRSAVGAQKRAAMSPSMALLTFQGNLTHFHVRDVLGSVHVPTLVVHRKGEAIPIEYAREVAAGIPSARIVELEGVDHRLAHLPDRVLAVLFTDIVDSTRHAARLGDRTWRELLARHDESPTPKSAASKGESYNTPATVFSRHSMADARPQVCDHGRGADAGIGYRCAMWSAHRRV